MNSLSLSAVIITLNEESNIQKCLDSVRFCDEVLVVDSGSSDNTIAIAQAFGARVISQEWLGYGPQKQFAVNEAKNPWVLCIDADELVSSSLQYSITQINLHSTAISAYEMPRKNHFLGQALHYGEGYPDFSLRLFHRDYAQWSNSAVHEGVETQGEKGRLMGDLLHYSEDTLARYLQKQNHYTSLQAQQLFNEGKCIHPIKCFTSPFLRFIKFYFLRRGFLDGGAGFIHIVIGCFNAFCKYAKLLELQRKNTSPHSTDNKTT
jgi:glycosyltransferase involved in cell wall biosynthesis